jgi:hypothetical protein
VRGPDRYLSKNTTNKELQSLDKAGIYDVVDREKRIKELSTK